MPAVQQTADKPCKSQLLRKLVEGVSVAASVGRTEKFVEPMPSDFRNGLKDPSRLYLHRTKRKGIWTSDTEEAFAKILVKIVF